MDIFSDNSKDGCSLLSSSNWMVFYKNFKENHKVIFQYISNLLKAYFVASLPFAVIYIVKNHTSDTFVTNFFASILWKGCSPHLWYFPATILALTICALLGIAMEKHSGGWLISIGWISNLMCSICDIYLHIFDFEMGGIHSNIPAGMLCKLIRVDWMRDV